MKNLKFEKIIKEQVQNKLKLRAILLEYSQGQIDKTIKRWENEPNFNRNIALQLIKTFDEKKGGLSTKLDIVVLPDKLKQGNNYLNIDNYSYEDMVKLIRSIPENIEKIKKDAVNRFEKEFDIDKATARSYVARFMNKKEELKLAAREGLEELGFSKEEILDLIPKNLQQRESFLDPRNWDWTSFEQMMDAIFPSQKVSSEEEINTASTENDKIYDKNGIEIYKGDDVNKCISYNPVTASGRKKYGWCVTQVGNTNYDFYRFGNQSPTFYFVFDRSKSSSPEYAPFDNKWHAFVIQVTADEKTYIVTSADNRGDIPTQPGEGWEGISKIVDADTWNKIKDLKDYFKPIALSKTEKARKLASGRNLTLGEFKELDQDEKILYIQGKSQKNNLSLEFLEILPKYKISYEGRTTTLANVAIDSGQEFPYSVLKNYESLAKRYAIFRFRHTDYSKKPIPLPYVKYLDEPAKEKYLKSYDNNLTFEYIEKYFGPEQAKKYANKQAENYQYLPESAVKYITNPRLKTFYSLYTKMFKSWKFSQNTNIDDEKLENFQEMPVQQVSPYPLTYDDWTSFTTPERQTIFKMAEKVNNKTSEKYEFINYTVPFFLMDGNKAYAFLPSDDMFMEWVISDMSGKELMRVEGDEVELGGKSMTDPYPDYYREDSKGNPNPDYQRIYQLSDLKTNNEPVSLSEIVVNKPGDFNPKHPGSDKRFHAWLKTNKIRILNTLSQTNDLVNMADITDFNNTVISNDNFLGALYGIEDEVLNEYPGGAIYAIYSPENIGNCRGIILTNLPEEVYEDTGSGLSATKLNIPTRTEIFYDFEYC